MKCSQLQGTGHCRGMSCLELRGAVQMGLPGTHSQAARHCAVSDMSWASRCVGSLPCTCELLESTLPAPLVTCPLTTRNWQAKARAVSRLPGFAQVEQAHKGHSGGQPGPQLASVRTARPGRPASEESERSTRSLTLLGQMPSHAKRHIRGTAMGGKPSEMGKRSVVAWPSR